MTKNRLKVFASAIILVPAFVMSGINSFSVPANAADDDAASTYKAKCAMCHGPTANKAYDATMSIEDQTQAILKGKKAEKPPNMPAFEAKGITEAQAKALAEYMKSLQAPAS